VLYGYADGALRAIEAASTKLSMTYRSPDFTAGSLTLPKVYKDIQVFSSGQIALTVYVNGQDAGTFNFTTTDSHEVKIDKAFMRGFYISFLVQGTGEVRTITWTDGTANV